MPKAFRRKREATSSVDIDAAIAGYGATEVPSSVARPTGLPSPMERDRPRLVHPPVPIDDVGLQPSEPEPEVEPERPPVDDGLIVGEVLTLEALDVDGTAYLFRGIVGKVSAEEVHVAVAAASLDALPGLDALELSSQVVAVIHRGDASWLLTTRVLGTSWGEAALVMALEPPQRAAEVGRRVHDRVALQARVALPAELGAVRASTIDLSPGGAGLLVLRPRRTPVGPFEMVMLTPEPVSVRATLVGSIPQEDGAELWRVQFVAIPADAIARLQELTAR